MREIKFRAWDNIDNKMIYDTYNIFEQWPNIYIMQYTGLKDKNWKEIYEDDLVVLLQKWHFTMIWKVIFINWWYEVRQRDWNRLWLFNDLIRTPEIKIEIIGNIYENSNLIK